MIEKLGTRGSKYWPPSSIPIDEQFAIKCTRLSGPHWRNRENNERIVLCKT